MLPFRLVYDEQYDLRLGNHVFPSKKYGWLHDRLIRTRFATAGDFAAPAPASDEDILLVHDPQWVQNCAAARSPIRIFCAWRFRIPGRWWRRSGWRRAAPYWRRAWRSNRAWVQPGRRIPSRVSRPRRGVLRRQRYGSGHPAVAARRRHPPRHGGGLRCPPRQRHRGDFRRRPFGVHALHSPVQQLSDREASLQPGHSPGGRGCRCGVSPAAGGRVSRGAGDVQTGAGHVRGGARTHFMRTNWAGCRSHSRG